MPLWAVQLEAAAEWGKAPHEIFGGSVYLWWCRWKLRRDFILTKAQGDIDNG
jgi:hypothetical protein